MKKFLPHSRKQIFLTILISSLVLLTTLLLWPKEKIHFSKNVFQAGEQIKASVSIPQLDQSKVAVFSPEHEKMSVHVQTKTVEGKPTLVIDPPVSMQPGMHTLEITDLDGSKITQNFMWGILALNPNKSIYRPNEKAYIAYAVLDEEGKMVCDADITLIVKNEKLKIEDELSTKNGLIKVNPECSKKALVTKDDFESSYVFKDTGTYNLHLSATTKNGTYSIDDQVHVRDTAPFDVERNSNTRIYPINKYPMKITVTANQDFNGTITEKVPNSFVLNQLPESSTPFQEEPDNSIDSSPAYQTKSINWQVSLKKGEKKVIGYSYDSPDASPWFFLTGPLQFRVQSSEFRVIFAEQRHWQIAVDDVAPVAYWKLDEGSGTTTNSSTATNKAGTLTSMASPGNGNSGWQNDGCVSGKCLAFDGSDDFVSVTDPVDGSLDFGDTTDFTIQAWVKSNSQAALSQGIVTKRAGAGDTTGYSINMTTGGLIRIVIDDNTNLTAGSVGTTSFNDGKWHHITVVFSRTDDLAYGYIDGVLVGSRSIATTTGSVSNSRDLWIGKNASNTLPGGIDDVKIYNYQRSATQIKADFNARGSAKGSGAVLGIATKNQSLTNGLQGYWKMDESAANGCTGGSNDSCDTSGNVNDMAWDTNAPTVALGKFGNGLDFEDSSSQFMSVADNTTLSITSNLTLSAWIKLESTNDEPIIAKDGSNSNVSFYIAMVSSKVRFLVSQTGSNGATIFRDSATDLSTGVWYHVTGVYNASTQTMDVYVNGLSDNGTLTGTVPTSIFDGDAAIYIGGNQRRTQYFDGVIDDARIYNRSFSPREVELLTNFGPNPIASWSFEEGTGTTVNDLSGSGNTGTISNIPQWKAGKVGSALDFNGAVSGGGIVTAGTNASVDNIKVKTISFWVYSRGSGGGGLGKIIGKLSGSTGYWELRTTGSGRLQYDHRFNGASATWLTDSGYGSINTWNHWTVIFDETSSSNDASFYLNGVLVPSTETVAPTGSSDDDDSGTVYIGNRADGTRTFDGTIDELRVYNYARTTKQIVEDMNGGHPSGGSPVGSQIGYWKMDEGYGDTTYDSSQLRKNGDMAGSGTTCTTNTGSCPQWRNDGKFRKGFYFDGDDYISLGNITEYKIATRTASFWAKPTSNITSTQGVLSAGSSNTYVGFGGSVGAPNRMLISFSHGTTGSQQTVTTAADTVTMNEWHHYAYTMEYVGMNVTVKMYKDGVLQPFISGTGKTTDGVSTTFGSSFVLGAATTSTLFYTGLLDNVKLYNSVLSSEELKVDMNLNSSIQLGALGTDINGTASSSAERSYCPPGDTTVSCSPVGEWKFEEGRGTTVYDTSTSGKDGTLNGEATFIPGKIGKGIKFGGTTSDYISIGNVLGTNFNDGDSFSISAWYKDTASGDSDTIISKKNSTTGSQGWMLWINSSDIPRVVISDGSNETTLGVGSAPTLNQWHQVTAVFQEGGATDTIYIYLDGVLKNSSATTEFGDINATTPISMGADSNDQSFPLEGQMDNTKIYNYALSSSQVAWDYNRGEPVAHWKMDENTGSTLKDSSGNGSNGTSFTGNTAYTTGKYNYGLTFDGTGDYATIGDPSSGILDFGANQDFSISTWIQRSSNVSSVYFISKGAGATATPGYSLMMLNGITPKLWLSKSGEAGRLSATATRDISDTSWHHLVVTVSRGGNATFYIDGFSAGTGDVSSYASDDLSSSTNFSIGCYSSGASCFPGQLDDVRVFNYVLTAQQVRNVMNDGAIRWGPSTGTP